jgi:hypothetical protein
VVLLTATHGQIRLRCVTQADAAQSALLDRLARRRLAQRMRLSERAAPATVALSKIPPQKCSADFSAKTLIRLLRGIDPAQVGLGGERVQGIPMRCFWATHDRKDSHWGVGKVFAC